MEDESGTPKSARREDRRRSKKDTSVPFDPTKDSLAVGEDIKAPTSSSRRRSSSESRRHSNSRGSSGNTGGSVTRKNSADASADRPSLEGIFNESDDDSGSDIFDVGNESASLSPRRGSGGGRRRSSHSIDESGIRRRSSRLQSQERSPTRKPASRGRRRSSKHPPEDSSPSRGRRAGRSTGPPSLSQTQHAARSLSAMGAGGSRSSRPKTRAELKEQGRVREWASFCRRKTYLSLEDLSREERPRVARKGAVTPFSLQLSKVKLAE